MGTPEKPERDELSVEISGAVDNAHITDTFTIGKDLMRVVNTQPYPKGEHPLEKMGRPTAPYPTGLLTNLLDKLCGQGPIIGIPTEQMGEDLGTGVPKEMLTDKDPVHELKTGEYQVVRRITQPLGTADYEVIGEGEQLLYSIAYQIASDAKMSIHCVETEKIEVEENERVNVEEDIAKYFDDRIQAALLSVLPDRRLETFFTLQALKKEICEQLIEVMPENQDRYLISIKNAITYIVDGVVSRGINKSITLEIPNV